MASFQNIVMTTASIILIICLIFIGIGLYRKKYKADYPPIIANCPDYWQDSSENWRDSSGNTNGSKCVNPLGLGKAGACNNRTTVMDFTTGQWTGSSGLCNKSKWAKECNLTWDGITNNSEICGK